MAGQTAEHVVRIGGASGALNDSLIAVPQLLRVPDLDYLAFDYLGEGSMGLMRRLKEADPRSGFLTDFVDLHIGPYLTELKSRGIKVIANAGGMNPEGLAELIRARGRELNLDLRVAAVTGDDIEPLLPALRGEDVRDMFTGIPLPEGRIGSINAYLGAFPIAAALDAGADIVITGRVVDSALILGPLIHEFRWGPEDLDLLAGGTLAGHLLECGTQVTGGTFTDWQDVPDWANIGFRQRRHCRRAAALRSQRSPGLYRSRRGLRLRRSVCVAGRPRSGQRRWREGLSPHGQLQGVRHL